MKYMLLIHSDEAYYGKLSEEQMGSLMEEYGNFQGQVEGAGVFLASHRLQPSSTATSVQLRDGESIITDGPYAETKEQMGGYYLIEATDLDAAIEWAKKVPTAKYGTIEVRPVWEMQDS